MLTGVVVQGLGWGQHEALLPLDPLLKGLLDEEQHARKEKVREGPNHMTSEPSVRGGKFTLVARSHSTIFVQFWAVARHPGLCALVTFCTWPVVPALLTAV